MPIINQYRVGEFKKKFPSIIWQCDDCFIASVMGFAAAIEKTERLEEIIKQVSFPTFFGKPTKVLMISDDTASFYFNIYLAEDVGEDGKLKPVKIGGPGRLMNGGVIFHPAYSTSPDGKEVRSNAGGDWSIHA